MADTLQPDHKIEIASMRRAAWPPEGPRDRINAHIARSEGYTQALGASWGQGAYALFEEMEEKDAHLYSVLQTRKNGLLARPTRIEPASAEPRDLEVARWIEGALARLPNLELGLNHMLDALAKGMSVVEIIWGYDAEGRIVPTELKPRSAWRFRFGPDGALRLADADPWTAAAPERSGQSGDANRAARTPMLGGPGSGAGLGARGIGGNGDRALPDRKFLVTLFNATDDRPYGRGLDERVYWYWWFKKNNLKFWVMHNEKFGAPTVVAKHAPGLSSVERDRLLEVISSLQADAGVTLPEGVTLELLEPLRRGSADTYRDMANWLNEEISRAVLGQTLTVSEGSRGGSMALGRVHDAVRMDYIRSDAQTLMGVLNGQLIRWMMDFNFGPGAAAPRWVVDLTPDVDPAVEAAIDKQLLQMGVPLPIRYFYSRYKRPAPGLGERQLRYDDTNLFQYHLQFGVLTVNEVRASLGLPPVAWGDEPTSPQSPQSPPRTPGGDTGEDPAQEAPERDEEEKGDRG